MLKRCLGLCVDAFGVKSICPWVTSILNSVGPMGFALMPELLVLIITLHDTLHNTHRMNQIKQDVAQQSVKFSEPQVQALRHWTD